MGTAKKRIILACIIGCVLIASALFVRYGIGSSKNVNTDEPAISVSNREHIQIYDSDDNGIPDWQEALFTGQTLLSASSSEEEYVLPDTLTGQFGIQLFKEIVLAHNYGVLNESGREALVEASFQRLQRENMDTPYTKKDIASFEAIHRDSLHDYGNQVALIILTNPSGKENEIDILEDALQKNNEARLSDLQPAIDAYANMTKQMLEINVPEAYIVEHLAVLNAFQAMFKDVEAMQNVYTDPLFALLRYKRYETDVTIMINAITRLYNTLYLEDGVRWETGEPVLQIVHFEE